MLRVITDFILFTRKDEELSKVVLRPHQMRAVERGVERAKDKKAAGADLAHAGIGQDLHDDHRGQAAHRDPVFENPTV